MAAEPDQDQLHDPVTDDDHRRGPDDAKVTLVVYGDYECPDTRAAHSVLKRLREHFGDDLAVVFRHFPRTHVHPNAEHAAIASEAAADKGRFWELHDLLLDHSGPLNEEAIDAYASSIGLNATRPEAGHPYATRVSDDVASGNRHGITGTPTIYINGRRHNGSYDERTLQAAIDLAR